MNYWEECIRIAFEDAKIEATEEQIDIVVEAVEGAHENYGMACGHDAIPNPLEAEVSNLKKKVEHAQRETAEVESDFRKNVAMRRNCRPEEVTLLGGGHAEF